MLGLALAIAIVAVSSIPGHAIIGVLIQAVLVLVYLMLVLMPDWPRWTRGHQTGPTTATVHR